MNMNINMVENTISSSSPSTSSSSSSTPANTETVAITNITSNDNDNNDNTPSPTNINPPPPQSQPETQPDSNTPEIVRKSLRANKGQKSKLQYNDYDKYILNRKKYYQQPTVPLKKKFKTNAKLFNPLPPMNTTQAINLLNEKSNGQFTLPLLGYGIKDFGVLHLEQKKLLSEYTSTKEAKSAFKLRDELIGIAIQAKNVVILEDLTLNTTMTHVHEIIAKQEGLKSTPELNKEGQAVYPADIIHQLGDASQGGKVSTSDFTGIGTEWVGELRELFTGKSSLVDLTFSNNEDYITATLNNKTGKWQRDGNTQQKIGDYCRPVLIESVSNANREVYWVGSSLMTWNSNNGDTTYYHLDNQILNHENNTTDEAHFTAAIGILTGNNVQEREEQKRVFFFHPSHRQEYSDMLELDVSKSSKKLYRKLNFSNDDDEFENHIQQTRDEIAKRKLPPMIELTLKSNLAYYLPPELVHLFRNVSKTSCNSIAWHTVTGPGLPVVIKKVGKGGEGWKDEEIPTSKTRKRGIDEIANEEE